MSMQQIMRWGHDFWRIRGGYSNLWGQWGKAKCERENPSNCQLPFLSHSPNHLLLPEIGWVGYCMGWARYDSPNSNWRSHQFLGNAFWPLGQVKTQKCMPFYHALMFLDVFTTIFPSCELFQASKTSCVCPHSMFLFLGFIFPWMGGCFCNAKDWVLFLTFLELLVHFPFTFL